MYLPSNGTEDVIEQRSLSQQQLVAAKQLRQEVAQLQFQAVTPCEGRLFVAPMIFDGIGSLLHQLVSWFAWALMTNRTFFPPLIPFDSHAKGLDDPCVTSDPNTSDAEVGGWHCFFQPISACKWPNWHNVSSQARPPSMHLACRMRLVFCHTVCAAQTLRLP